MGEVHANILVEPLADDAVLRPGVYSARAQDPAYGGLEAMVADERATYIGERYEVDGSKWIAVRVTEGSRFAPNPPVTMQWGIDENFYSSALKTYHDWQEKWWREAIQNSADAGATRIDCRVEPVPEGFAASVTDNGKGMAVPIMEKFLMLGGTSKTSSAGTAGGFGKAKELLVMPWLAWSIDSLGQRMVGQGGTPPVRDDSPFRQGTELRVVMAPDQTTHESCAIAYIEKCYLPGVRLTVNGKTHKADLAPGEEIRTFGGGKATLYHDKSKKPGRLLVRTMGLFMFELDVSESVKGMLIIELTGASVDLLTDNRDGFRDWGLKQSIEKFTTSLSADVRSALKKKQGIIREKFHGTGKFHGAPEKALQANVLKHLEEVVPAGKTRGGPALSEAQRDLIRQVIDQEGGGEVTETVHGAPRGAPGGDEPQWGEPGAGGEPQWGEPGAGGEPQWEAPGAGSEPRFMDIGHTGLNLRAFGGLVSAMLDGTIMPGPTAVEAAVKQLVWEPDFLLVNVVPGYHVPKMFWPEGMSPTMKKLARFWAELCRFVLIQVGSPEPYGVGFIFDHGMLAAYQRDSNTGEHWLLLNPYRIPSAIPTERGKKPAKDELYGIVDEEDLNTLYALAIHEVTHMADGIYYSFCEPEDEGIQKEKHDEAFASAFTRNVARCAGKERQIREIRKAVAARALGSARGGKVAWRTEGFSLPLAEGRARGKKPAAFPPLADAVLEEERQRTTRASGYRYSMFVGEMADREYFTDDLTSEQMARGHGLRDVEWRDKEADGRAVWRDKRFGLPLAGAAPAPAGSDADDYLPPLADKYDEQARYDRAREMEGVGVTWASFKEDSGAVWDYAGSLDTLIRRSTEDITNDDIYFEIRSTATGLPVWRSDNFGLRLAPSHAANRAFQGMHVSVAEMEPEPEEEDPDEEDEDDATPHGWTPNQEDTGQAGLYLEHPYDRGSPWRLVLGREQAVVSAPTAYALVARWQVPVRDYETSHEFFAGQDDPGHPMQMSAKAGRLFATAHPGRRR